MRYFCCDERRLEVIKLTGSANGIEFLEVRDRLEPDTSLRQRTLFVRMLRPGFALTPDHVRIDGGERVRVVPVEWTSAADALPAGVDPELLEGIDDLARTLVVRTAITGDFSRYALRLRASAGSDDPPVGFDPRLSSIDFSFKIECPSDFDCAVESVCAPAPSATPEIDYLAKDFTGFRRLMLDRLNLLAPGWSERSAADVGVALVELLAYAADNLSYRQDAIANEAYLGTARRRVSVRRHTRLVDYRLHDGCNARAFVHVAVSADQALPRGTPMLTRSGNRPRVLTPDSRDLRDALSEGATVFETAHDAALVADLNTLSFHTWGDLGCCLPRGATSATLRGAHPALKVNDVLVFQELRSPTTFTEADADRAKRWAVRLVEVTTSVDPSGGLFDEEPVDAPVDVTEITWDASDALPFPFCISVTERPGLAISHALGNIVLVDHGRTIAEERLGAVPETRLRRVSRAAVSESCADDRHEDVPVRFRPPVRQAPVTQAFDLARELTVPLTEDEGWWSARALIARDPHDALPAITPLRGSLEIDGASGVAASTWYRQRDLLASKPDDMHFMAETENDGTTLLRFGDDVHGQRPNAGTAFFAVYRTGNGAAGNVGADTIHHIVSDTSGVFLELRNPMPAAGGIDPESIEAARRDAPEAFRTQERAVTAEDYAVAAQRRVDVPRAAATFRWTGSWHTVFVTADRVGGAPVDARFESRLRRHLERFRMAGYDLEVDAPQPVALDVTLHVCVRPDYFRSDVLRAVSAVLGSGVLPDGRLGVFHPDNFSFGQPVYLSRIIAAAQAVEGVEAVQARRFQRMGVADGGALESGVIPVGRLEIAGLANDPNFPERGRLNVRGGGGK